MSIDPNNLPELPELPEPRWDENAAVDAVVRAASEHNVELSKEAAEAIAHAALSSSQSEYTWRRRVDRAEWEDKEKQDFIRFDIKRTLFRKIASASAMGGVMPAGQPVETVTDFPTDDDRDLVQVAFVLPTRKASVR